MFEKQVEKSHYQFSSYMSKARWNSIWHQIDEVQKLAPEQVLEIGPGPGIFKAITAQLNIRVETLDIDPELKPDHIASATKMPFQDASYDVVCAFQMLEHLPYDTAIQAFHEMVRVSKSHVVISLPDAKRVWRYTVQIPGFGVKELFLPRPRFRPLAHKFDGEHHWEINKRGYALKKVIRDLSDQTRLLDTYRVSENSYHRFLIFKKNHDELKNLNQSHTGHEA